MSTSTVQYSTKVSTYHTVLECMVQLVSEGHPFQEFHLCFFIHYPWQKDLPIKVRERRPITLQYGT